MEGEWENQRQGLIDALYGAKINGKIINKHLAKLLMLHKNIVISNLKEK
jgi:hypothetical protein